MRGAAFRVGIRPLRDPWPGGTWPSGISQTREKPGVVGECGSFRGLCFWAPCRGGVYT